MCTFFMFWNFKPRESCLISKYVYIDSQNPLMNKEILMPLSTHGVK